MREDMADCSPRRRPHPVPVKFGAEVLLPAVWELYMAVRGFGGRRALAHVYMVYSVSAESVI
jgi:hypothetical protein